VAAAGGVLLYRRFSRPADPDEAERRRRARVNQIGRIVEGQVIDLLESASDGAKVPTDAPGVGQPGNGHRRLVCYSYSISGVTYETAQDITGLEDHAILDRIVAGQPASVKYDPSNPSNSILLADDWSGLR